MSLLATAAKFSAFALLSALCAVLVVNTLQHPLDGATRDYRAVFTDAQGVKPGSEVRVAGVRVAGLGQVGVEAQQQHLDGAGRPGTGHARGGYASTAPGSPEASGPGDDDGAPR